MNSHSIKATISSWRIMYALVLGGILLYLLGWATDTTMLGERAGIATVFAKEHHEANQTYTMEQIGGITRAIPRMIPEEHILKLRLENHELDWPVAKDYFLSMRVGQQVRVRYHRRRLTGSLRVVAIDRD